MNLRGRIVTVIDLRKCLGLDQEFEDAQSMGVTVEYNGHSYRGHGISTDIVEAGALAYLEVINRVSRRMETGDNQPASPASKDAAAI